MTLYNSWSKATPLPSPQSLRHTAQDNDFQLHARQEIIDILEGRDKRLLLIAGPCSVHDTTAALDYARKLKGLADEVSDTFCTLMRVYFEKPRTALGWKGILYDPTLDGSGSIADGLIKVRHLLADINALGLATAAEFLSATTPQYFGDLISWGTIGARTVSSQPHRQMASGLPMPVGVKNSVDGSMTSAIDAICVIRKPHTHIGIDADGKACAIETKGNPYAHLVLRGGHSAPNYHPTAVADALDMLKTSGLPQRLIVDCSHDNSGRCPQRQAMVLRSVIDQVTAGNDNILGVMLESNLESGRQDLSDNLRYGVSLTDPCMDWATTEQIVRDAYTRMGKTLCLTN